MRYDVALVQELVRALISFLVFGALVTSNSNSFTILNIACKCLKKCTFFSVGSTLDVADCCSLSVRLLRLHVGSSFPFVYSLDFICKSPSGAKFRSVFCEQDTTILVIAFPAKGAMLDTPLPR